jgi:hypothetical protein
MKLQTMLANPKTTHVAHALAAIPLPRVDKGREEISGGKDRDGKKTLQTRSRYISKHHESRWSGTQAARSATG